VLSAPQPSEAFLPRSEGFLLGPTK